MHAAYKVLAFLIVALVAVQAAAHAWASSGLVRYLAQGGTIDFESTEAPPVPEFLGLMIHGMNGMFVIPAVAIGFLILALLTKSSHAIIWAGAVGGLVALQVTFGLLGHETSAFALLHGLNAIVLAGTALAAGILAFRTTGVAATSRAPAAARVA